MTITFLLLCFTITLILSGIGISVQIWNSRNFKKSYNFYDIIKLGSFILSFCLSGYHIYELFLLF
jgi:hypothetical protein